MREDRRQKTDGQQEEAYPRPFKRVFRNFRDF
jgi:hypothetical protein